MKSMTKLSAFVIGAAFLMAASTWAATPGAGIAGTDHDFSSDNWDGHNQICVVCHTYVLYSSPTLNATDISQPTGASKLCLSCHDGTVAVDAFGGRNGTEFMSGKKAVGADELANDHPISFTYDTALAQADGELKDPATASSGKGGTIDADLLFNGKLECSSCHDVHNTDTVDGDFLRLSRTQSAICLTCHIK